MQLMHIKTSLSLALFLVGVASPALAVEGGETYFGAGVSRTTLDADSGEEFEPTAGIGRLGYGFADNFAIEGRAGFGITDDDVGNTGVDVGVEGLYGAYLVGHLPVADRFSVYGLAGLSMVEFELSDSSVSNVGITFDDSGFSYGIGAEVSLTEMVSGYVEYTHYLEGDLEGEDYDVRGTMIGAKYNF